MRSTDRYQTEKDGQRINIHCGGYVLKPLSHSKTLTTHFMVVEMEHDENIPTFMVKSRMRTLGSRLANLSRYLDKCKINEGLKNGDNIMLRNGNAEANKAVEPIKKAPKPVVKKPVLKMPENTNFKQMPQHPHVPYPRGIPDLCMEDFNQETDLTKSQIKECRARLDELVDFANEQGWDYYKHIKGVECYTRMGPRGVIQVKGVINYPFTANEIISQVMLIEERKMYDDQIDFAELLEEHSHNHMLAYA